jgi:hypothetical protein
MVDLKSKRWIQVSEGIVRKARKMNDGIQALQVIVLYITNVFLYLRDRLRLVSKGAAFKKVAI